MQSIEDKVLSRIYGRGRGWAFSEKDFTRIGSSESVRLALCRLTKAGKIRRVMRGVYDYPKFSELLNEELPPDLTKVAQALARKSGWRIQPSGPAALNALGLSTQVPGRILFSSDGPARTYDVMGVTLTFRPASLKESALKDMQSELVVQAVKSLGKERMSDEIRSKVRTQLSERQQERLLRDATYVTGWIYDEIKKICQEED